SPRWAAGPRPARAPPPRRRTRGRRGWSPAVSARRSPGVAAAEVAAEAAVRQVDTQRQVHAETVTAVTDAVRAAQVQPLVDVEAHPLPHRALARDRVRHGRQDV